MDKKLYGRVQALVASVLTISVGTLVVAALVGANDAVWTRGIIVTVIAALLIALARRAFLGSRGAYRRIRYMTTIAPVATVVIVALPNDGYPAWMKVEQTVVGLLLLAIAISVGRKAVSQAYRAAGESVG